MIYLTFVTFPPKPTLQYGSTCWRRHEALLWAVCQSTSADHSEGVVQGSSHSWWAGLCWRAGRGSTWNSSWSVDVTCCIINRYNLKFCFDNFFGMFLQGELSEAFWAVGLPVGHSSRCLKSLWSSLLSSDRSFTMTSWSSWETSNGQKSLSWSHLWWATLPWSSSSQVHFWGMLQRSSRQKCTMWIKISKSWTFWAGVSVVPIFFFFNQHYFYYYKAVNGNHCVV